MNNTNATSSLRQAIKSGDISQVKELLQATPSLRDASTPFGGWLHIAASHGQLEIAAWLVDAGVSIDMRGGIEGSTPLHLACAEGQYEIAAMLLARGAQMDTDLSEHNPLFAAIHAGRIDLVKMLVEHGIDTTVRYTGKHMTNMGAEDFATERGELEIAEYLHGIENSGSIRDYRG